jgi:hypothetical protein
MERTAYMYTLFQKDDLSASAFEGELNHFNLHVPSIPNIEHWFKRYVIVDLAHIKRAIFDLDTSASNREFFILCFAAIIRNVSNADPVPVSGLEVTSHMKRLIESGRYVNPFQHFRERVRKSINQTDIFCQQYSNGVRAEVVLNDASCTTKALSSPYDVVITSPPYLSAVDYYRRHTLEMYWADLVSSHEKRLSLLPSYIGRTRVANKHISNFTWAHLPNSIQNELSMFSEIRRDQQNALIHYFGNMRQSMLNLLSGFRTDSRGRIIIVIGASKFAGVPVNTPKLMARLVEDQLRVVDHLAYDLKNRYMSYKRRNGADIAVEHVLVFEPR